MRHGWLIAGAVALASSQFFGVAAPALASVAPADRSDRKPAKIRVRLAESAEGARVRGYDLKVEEVHALARALNGTTEWTVSCAGGWVSLQPVGRGADVKALHLASPVALRSPAGFLSFEGHPYRAVLRVYSKYGPRSRGCEVVNELDLEKYLDGLVNSEFSSKWNEQAIEAQVVAARSYAYFQIRDAHREHSERHYDLDATVKDQVYDGSMKEDFRSVRSVDKTRGLVLAEKAEAGLFARKPASSGKPAPVVPIKAFYSSTCGGHTELPEHVWGTRYAGLHHSVTCPFCVSSPRFHWSLNLSAGEVAQAVARGAVADGKRKGWPEDWRQIVEHGMLIGLEPGPLDREERRLKVMTTWAYGAKRTQLTVAAARFREWVGPARLRSTAFEVLPLPGTQGWRIDGLGSGHGVGMCQWGAKVMGERGYTMAEILKRYYPDAVLRKAW